MGRLVRSCLLASFSVMLATFSTQGWAQEMRQWTDATGKFKIQAKFVKEEGGNVTLLQADGEELEIELKNLSTADQKVVADLKKAAASNPFKTKGTDPFKPKSKGTGTTPSTPSGTAAGNDPTEPLKVEVNWEGTTATPLTPDSDEWKAEITPAEAAFKGRVKTVALPPKSNFFEGLKGMAVNAVAKKAVLTYNIDQPKPTGTTRVVICDLETGKAGTVASHPSQMVPMALHDDGKRILMRRADWGFGNSNRVEIWTLKGSKVVRHLEFEPYAVLKGWDVDCHWGQFLDDERFITCGTKGRVAIWKIETGELLSYFQTDGAAPALSPDKQHLVFADDGHVCVYDIANEKVLYRKPLPGRLFDPRFEYSPSGKYIGCVAQDRVLCWDATNGEVRAEIPSNGAHIQGFIDFVHDDFLMTGNHIVMDLENKLMLWTYNGGDQIQTVGGMTFIASTDGSKPGALFAASLPHSTALDIQKKTLTDPNLFVFKSGTVVKLDVNGIPDAAAKDQVTKDLTKKLQDAGCTVGANGTIDLVASVEGPTTREISFIIAGDYKMQEYKTNLKFVYQGKVAWQTNGTNVPGGISRKQGESIESILRSMEKPQYQWFTSTALPKFLQKPAQNTGPQSVFTIGASQITTTGIK